MRSTIALAAIHVICGKGEIFKLPTDIQRNKEAPDDNDKMLDLVFNEPGKLGLRLQQKDEDGMKSARWKVNDVEEGSLACQRGVQVVPFSGAVPLSLGTLRESMVLRKSLELLFCSEAPWVLKSGQGCS